MKPHVKKWIMGLVGGAVNSAASSVTVVIVAPETFNLTSGLANLGQSSTSFVDFWCCSLSKTTSNSG